MEICRAPGLNTDLYELTMAAGYFENGKAAETTTFLLFFFRRLPRCRSFVMARGLAHVVDYLLNLRFESEEIRYLQGLPQFKKVSAAFSRVSAAVSVSRATCSPCPRERPSSRGSHSSRCVHR